MEYGDAAIAADPAGAHVISHVFPHTYGQPLAHFLRKTAVVPDAKVISEHLAVRYIFHVPVHEKSFACQKSSLKDVNLILYMFQAQGWHCLLWQAIPRRPQCCLGTL